jgi:exopolyphosphatase/guanosine-5'-triphosphate,3'-diphosphate pyrophosphatase
LRFPAIGLTHDDKIFLALTILVRYGGNLNNFELEKWNEGISRDRLDTALKIGTAIRLGIELSAGLDGRLKQIEMVKYEKIIMIRYTPEVISISRRVMEQKMGNLLKHFSCSVEFETSSGQSVPNFKSVSL